MWSWHILHPEAFTNGLVNNTRGMFWSNRGLYSNEFLGVTSCPPSRTPYTRDLTIFYISTMLFDVCDQSCFVVISRLWHGH